MIITVSREFGSGGREFAAMLADRTGFAYFDKEIIDMIKNETGLSQEYIDATVENNYTNFLYSGFLNVPPQGVGARMAVGYNIGSEILQAQSDIIEKIANENGNCIIVGRCADYILRNRKPFRVFVYCDEISKLKRCKNFAQKYEIGSDLTLGDKKILKNIAKINKKRAKYYKFCTGRNWGERENYDLMVNSANPIDKLVDIVSSYINK